MPMLTLFATSKQTIKSRTVDDKWVMFTPGQWPGTLAEDEGGDLVGHGQHRLYVQAEMMHKSCVPTCIR
jgi:hypothetical protein